MTPLGHHPGPKSPILVPERHSVPVTPAPTRIPDFANADLPPETIEEAAASFRQEVQSGEIRLDPDFIDRLKSKIKGCIDDFYRRDIHRSRNKYSRPFYFMRLTGNIRTWSQAERVRNEFRSTVIRNSYDRSRIDYHIEAGYEALACLECLMMILENAN